MLQKEHNSSWSSELYLFYYPNINKSQVNYQPFGSTLCTWLIIFYMAGFSVGLSRESKTTMSRLCICFQAATLTLRA